MSSSREHKRRYNRKLEYIAEFSAWLEEEPSYWRILSRAKWKKRRPVFEEDGT